MTGIVIVAVMFSFAGLVYSGELASSLPTGAGLFLIGAAVMNLVAARWTSIKGAVIIPQDATTAVVAVSLAALLPAVAGEARLESAIAYAAIATIAAGTVMLLLGLFRLGDLVRFVPRPVIGGFLGGTGWLLVVGAVDLATGGFGTSSLEIVNAGLAALFGVALVAILRFRPSAMLLPAMVVGAVVLFYIALFVSGTSVEEARSAGFLPMVAGLEVGFSGLSLGAIDWSVLGAGMGGLLTVPLVATLALLLNVTSLEVIGDADADLDRELTTTGAANLIASVTGSPAGYHTLGLTAIGLRVGVASRAIPVVVAAVCLVALAGGATVTGLFPTSIMAGVLLMVGLGFLIDWLYDGRQEMTGVEWLLMVAIVIAVATLGFLAAVLLGMGAAVALFAIAYSQIDPIRSVATGRQRRSTVDRTLDGARLLAEHGDEIVIAELQGYLFFGTARTLVNRMRQLVTETPALRFLVIEMRRVSGADSTALASFATLRRLAAEKGLLLIFSDVPPSVSGPLKLIGRAAVFATDLDHALERAEEAILGDADEKGETRRDRIDPDLWAELEPHLERLELEAGDVLVEHGDHSVGVFIIEQGRILAEIPTDDGRWRRVRSTASGAIFGEMSLYLEAGRTARLRAEEPTTVYSLGPSGIAGLERDRPEVAAKLHRLLALTLAERLALSNETVRALSL